MSQHWVEHRTPHASSLKRISSKEREKIKKKWYWTDNYQFASGWKINWLKWYYQTSNTVRATQDTQTQKTLKETQRVPRGLKWTTKMIRGDYREEPEGKNASYSVSYCSLWFFNLKCQPPINLDLNFTPFRWRHSELRIHERESPDVSWTLNWITLRRSLTLMLRVLCLVLQMSAWTLWTSYPSLLPSVFCVS